jgi:hypothetical protein
MQDTQIERLSDATLHAPEDGHAVGAERQRGPDPVSVTAPEADADARSAGTENGMPAAENAGTSGGPGASTSQVEKRDGTPSPTLSTSAPLPPAEFEHVHLFPGETAEAFASVLAGVQAAIRPIDFLELCLTHDIAELLWESRRDRRLANALQAAEAIDVLKETLRNCSRSDDHPQLAHQWGSKDPTAIERVNALLRQIGLSADSILAKALSRKIEDVERFDRLAANKTARRDNLLREIERHRAAAQERPRGEEPEDAEFEIVGDPSEATVPTAPERTAFAAAQTSAADIDQAGGAQ